MGREVRRVTANWQHPKQADGRYQPMFDRTFAGAARAWLDEAIAWDNGIHEDLIRDPSLKAKYPFWWQWSGGPPDAAYYRPEWSEEPTHFQMYEDTSEGTPISPVMETPELLARWLADTGASAFGDMTATYEQWLSVCRGRWSPSAVVRDGEMVSGVAYAAEHDAGQVQAATTPVSSTD
jgi:hypothetical protein